MSTLRAGEAGSLADQVALTIGQSPPSPVEALEGLLVERSLFCLDPKNMLNPHLSKKMWLFLFSFTFRAFSRRFYPKKLTIITFVRRKRNNNISLSVQLGCS